MEEDPKSDRDQEDYAGWHATKEMLGPFKTVAEAARYHRVDKRKIYKYLHQGGILTKNRIEFD